MQSANEKGVLWQKTNNAYENIDLVQAVQLMDEADKLAKQKEIEAMIANQELAVVNTSIIEDWLTGANAQVLVQNRTNK